MDSLLMGTQIGGIDLWPRERAAGCSTYVQISWITVNLVWNNADIFSIFPY